MKSIAASIVLVVLLTSCSKDISDAKENYIETESALLSASEYFDKILTNDFRVYLRFEDDGKLSVAVYQKDFWIKEEWVQNEIFSKHGEFREKDFSNCRVFRKNSS